MHSTFFSALQMQGLPNPCFGLHLHCFLRSTKKQPRHTKTAFFVGPPKAADAGPNRAQGGPKKLPEDSRMGPQTCFLGPNYIPELIPKPASWGPQQPEVLLIQTKLAGQVGPTRMFGMVLGPRNSLFWPGLFLFGPGSLGVHFWYCKAPNHVLGW